MEDRKLEQGAKLKKLVLKKDTLRVLDSKEARRVVGGMMAATDRECSCTCKCKTILSTTCCK